MELAGAASPQLPVSHVAPPRLPPQRPEKDSCEDTGDMRISEEKTCTDQELDADQTNRSSLNSSSECENQAPSNDGMTGSESKLEGAKTEGGGWSEEKALKKPDKILPCPRCNSMDTKFCYYNNYNINQPRHFCKSCQRYWTAGGSMRNIPVGAGRRKSKSSTANCRSILIPGSSLAAPAGDAPIYSLSMKANQAAAKFGPDSPLYNSMASVLKVGERSKNANPTSAAQPGNGENQACQASDGSRNESMNGTVSGHKNGTVGHSGVTPIHPIPCFPGPPFVYPWNPAWSGIPAMAAPVCPAPAEPSNSSENGNASNVQWSMPPMIPVPGYCGPAIPFPVIPSSVWPFISPWTNGAWSSPWLVPSCSVSASSPTSSSACSDNGSPVLGKHSRDSKPQGEEKTTEKNLWIPKTLRIDDPDEAAKSSIWTTLGIEPGERGMFRPFQSKAEAREQISGAARFLQANPAAMSRSQSFQETT
ncbi:hypothetical protein ABZP36_000526 [Zizania latifolia]